MRALTSAPLAALAAATLLAGCTVVVRPGDPSAAPPTPQVDSPPAITAAPQLVVIDGSPVQYVLNWHEDLFYYGGRWYRPYRGTWYYATVWHGPWFVVAAYRVPRPVLEVPRDYRTRPRPGSQQAVVVQPAPPAQQTVIVQAPPPAQQTVIVQAPPPAQQTVVVQAPAPPAVLQAPAPPVIVQAPPPVVVQAPPPVIVRAPPAAGRPFPAAPPPPVAGLPPAPAAPAAPEPPAAPAQTADRRGGPPDHAPAYGLRARTGLPPVTVTPRMAAIAGSPVSYAENWPDDLFLFEGAWYRTSEGAWYRAKTVGAEWTAVPAADVPAAVREVPRDYRAKKAGPAVVPRLGARGKKDS